MKIAFVILTWGDAQERKENFKFSLNSVKKLSNFLNYNGISSQVFPYCFGKEKLTDDSNHINLESLEYYRSFKINYVIKDLIIKNQEPEIFCCLDSDIFTLDRDFNNFLGYVKNTNFKEKFLTARWYDSADRNAFDFNNYTHSDNMPIETIRSSDASGFFLVDFLTLKNMGGYDERFTVWGGEDNDIAYRLQRMGVKQEYMDFFFLHIKHARINEVTILDTKDKDLYLNQVKIVDQDKSIIRPTIVNNYYIKNLEN